MTTRQKEKAVTWFQVSNAIPIAFTLLMGVIGITGFFYAIKGSVEVINVKLEAIIENQNEFITVTDNINLLLRDHEKRIQFLENTR